MSATTTGWLKKIRDANTPQLVRWSLFANWGLSVLLTIAAISTIQSQRHAIKTVGLDAAPNILNAQRIQDSLADLDANVASELLAPSGRGKEEVERYDRRREKLSKLLVSVSENITYGDRERLPIQTIQLKLGDYIQWVQQARYFKDSGNQKKQIEAYRAAAELMDKTILPAAAELAEVNNTQLNISYLNERSTVASSLFVVTLLGFLLLGTLVGTQVFLSYRMRRMLNPGLLTATAIAAIFLGYTNTTLNSASEALRVAKEDAFDSLYALRVARALAYSANGDRSRYLLDRSLAEKYQQAFVQKINQIARIPDSQTFDSVSHAYRSTSDREFRVEGFQGLFAKVFHNITFPGEREVAAEMLQSFGFYFKIDQEIRQLTQSGKIQDAIAWKEVSQSTRAFNQYKEVHQKVMNINMAAFQASILQALQAVGVDTAFQVKVNPNPLDAQTKAANEAIEVLDPTDPVEIRTLTRFEMIAFSAVVAIALFTFVGLSPRLKEYSV